MLSIGKQNNTQTNQISATNFLTAPNNRIFLGAAGLFNRFANLFCQALPVQLVVCKHFWRRATGRIFSESKFDNSLTARSLYFMGSI